VAGVTLWRIARRPYALDRQGLGARENGGRWNSPGTSVIHTGRTVGIAALEKFVHLAGVVPPDLVLVRVELPDGGSCEEPALGDLPADWNATPPVPATMRFGTTWAHENRSLVLYVPSVLALEERIGVVNPNHPEFPGTTMAIEREFRYDPRMVHPRLPSARV
jgi:RES domain-containing protein